MRAVRPSRGSLPVSSPPTSGSTPAPAVSAIRPTAPDADALVTPLRAITADGVSLHVKHVAAQGLARGAVILCHGLASNGFAFDLPGRSLARYLSGLGYECFIPDLRGTGDSDMPPGGHWGLDEYLEMDIPAILKLVCGRAVQDRLYWVGHSMGGILFMLHASDHPGVPVQRATTIASSLDYRHGVSVYQYLERTRHLWPRHIHLPFHKLSRLSAVTGRRGVPLLPELINFRRSNLELEVRTAILKHGFGRIPKRLLDDLSTALSERGVSRRGGRHRYVARLRDYRVPLQLIAGAGDWQCSVKAVEHTAHLLSHVRDVQINAFGKAYGHVDDYGHFDLIVGRQAEREVWPTIAHWFEEDAEVAAQ